MLRLLNEIKRRAESKKRLSKAKHFILNSKLLLVKVKAYEMEFSINPDYGTQDVTQIGNNKTNTEISFQLIIAIFSIHSKAH